MLTCLVQAILLDHIIRINNTRCMSKVGVRSYCRYSSAPLCRGAGTFFIFVRILFYICPANKKNLPSFSLPFLSPFPSLITSFPPLPIPTLSCRPSTPHSLPSPPLS